MVDDDDAIAHAHHHAHVMLDQQHRDAALADLRGSWRRALTLLRVHARGRLVEQQQSRLSRERDARSPDGAARRRAVAGEHVRVAVEIEEVREFRGARSAASSRRRDRAGARTAREPARPSGPVRRREMLSSTSARKQAGDLERARDAEPRHRVRGQAGESCAVERDRVRLDGSIEPASMLNNVVLPAPFGPIRPTISPATTWNVTSLTATSPPKRRVSR